MCAYQTGSNVLVAMKAEKAATPGTAALTTTITSSQLRIIDSPGMKLNRAVVQSAEKRADGFKTMGRLGGKSTDGSYNCEVSPGGMTDHLIEAVMRSTWSTAVAIGFATMTTVAMGTLTLTAAAGDWVGTEGVRVGDVFRITGTTVSGNNNLNSRVVTVNSLTITTTPLTFTTLVATATGTLTRLRKLISATTPTRRSWTIEQHDTDTDLSELYLGSRCTGMSLSCKPGQHATAQYTFVGMDRTALVTATSPWFVSPVLSTDLGMIADDSVILKDGVAVADFNSFDLNFSIAAATEPVIGSLVSPDVFDNDCTVTGTISGLRDSFAGLTDYDAETEFSISILLEESETAPADCLAIYIPRAVIANLHAPVGGGDGAKIETWELMIGPKVAATGHDATIAAFHTSEIASHVPDL